MHARSSRAHGAGPVLTERELNRALLARQLLLERSTASLPRVLERMAGLQAQYAPSMYVGLWSRVKGFERDHLTGALEQRQVVQGTLMRITIHLVSAGDYWPFAMAVRDARRAVWLRSHRQLTEGDMEAAASRLRERLRDGPIRRADLVELVGRAESNGVGLWLDLVRVPPSGTWERRRADVFAAAEDWLGSPDVATGAAVEHLVRRYLGGFGPASTADIADWAGLPVREVAAVVGRLPLRRFRSENGDELLDLPRAPLPGPDTPAPVRFLPVWDASLLVHARRTAILPEEHRPLVFNTKTPHSVQTFIVDGVVAGTWKHDGGRVGVEPFGPLDAPTRRAVDEEAEKLALLYE